MVMVHLGYQAVCAVRVQWIQVCRVGYVGRPQLEASDTHTHTKKKIAIKNYGFLKESSCHEMTKKSR